MAFHWRDPLDKGPEKGRVAVHPFSVDVSVPVNVPLGAGVNVPTSSPEIVPVTPFRWE